MSARHSVKCTKEQAQEFKNKVLKFLKDKNLSFVKVIALRCYDGQVKVFTGDTMNRMRLRQGRKLLAFRTPSGEIEGTPEGIAYLKTNGGDAVYERTSEPMEEKEYFPVYRADNWEAEKMYLKESLTQKGEHK